MRGMLQRTPTWVRDQLMVSRAHEVALAHWNPLSTGTTLQVPLYQHTLLVLLSMQEHGNKMCIWLCYAEFVSLMHGNKKRIMDLSLVAAQMLPISRLNLFGAQTSSLDNHCSPMSSILYSKFSAVND